MTAAPMRDPGRVYAWHGLAALWFSALTGWGLLSYAVYWELRRPDPIVIEGCPTPKAGRKP